MTTINNWMPNTIKRLSIFHVILIEKFYGRHRILFINMMSLYSKLSWIFFHLINSAQPHGDWYLYVETLYCFEYIPGKKRLSRWQTAHRLHIKNKYTDSRTNHNYKSKIKTLKNCHIKLSMKTFIRKVLP